MKSRRKILATIASAPVWVTPIVGAVVLPAHAQTSSTATQSPQCTTQVMISAFAGSISIGIDGMTCQQNGDPGLTGRADAIDATQTTFDFMDADGSFSFMFPRGMASSNNRITFILDSIGRRWSGSLNYAYPGSSSLVTITGVMTLV